MLRCKMCSLLIQSIGYDVQCTRLEVEFYENGQVWEFFDVPEDLWYMFKRTMSPDLFFREFIQGQFAENRII